MDINSYLHRSVYDLLTLKGKIVVITGGARGLGLAFAYAVAEVGGDVAVVDAADEPHEHLWKLQKESKVTVKYYK